MGDVDVEQHILTRYAADELDMIMTPDETDESTDRLCSFQTYLRIVFQKMKSEYSKDRQSGDFYNLLSESEDSDYMAMAKSKYSSIIAEMSDSGAVDGTPEIQEIRQEYCDFLQMVIDIIEERFEISTTEWIRIIPNDSLNMDNLETKATTLFRFFCSHREDYIGKYLHATIWNGSSDSDTILQRYCMDDVRDALAIGDGFTLGQFFQVVDRNSDFWLFELSEYIHPDMGFDYMQDASVRKIYDCVMTIHSREVLEK